MNSCFGVVVEMPRGGRIAHPVVQVAGGAVLVVVDAVGVELECLERGVDGHGYGSPRGHGGHQLGLVAGRHVHETHVVGARVLGVVPVSSTLPM